MSATNLAPHGSCSFLIDSEKPGDIRRSEALLDAPVRAHDSHTVSKSRAGVEMSLDTARRSACATSATNLPPTWLFQFPHRFGKARRSEEHTSELQSLRHLVCRLLLEKKKKKTRKNYAIMEYMN